MPDDAKDSSSQDPATNPQDASTDNAASSKDFVPISKEKKQNKVWNPDKSEEPDNDDPLGIRKGAGGIGALIIICMILYAVAKFGPGGAEKLGEWTQEAFGLGQQEPADPAKQLETVSDAPTPVAVAESSAPVKNSTKNSPKRIKPVVVKKTALVPAASSTLPASRDQVAAQQIQEALGGPSKADVRHIAFSRDFESMIAAVRLLDSQQLVEISFEKDNYGRFVSIPDSPVDQPIKVWGLDTE